MATEVKVPVLPESVADATVSLWNKKPGDRVSRDENLLELETDKVVLEVPAPVDGILGQINYQEGETVSSGQILALIEDITAAAGRMAEPVVTPPVGQLFAAKKTAEPVAPPPVAPPISPFPLSPHTPEPGVRPVFSPNLENRPAPPASPKVAQVRSSIIPPIAASQPPPRSASAASAPPAPVFPPKSAATIPAFTAPSASSVQPSPIQAPAPKAPATDSVSLPPGARFAAFSEGVNPSEVQGSGRRGAVTKEDILNTLKNNTQPAPAAAKAAPAVPQAPVATPPAPTSAAAAPQPALPATQADLLSLARSAGAATANGLRPEERVAMTRIRKRIAQRLMESKNSIAMLTTFNEVNLSKVAALRKQLGEDFHKTYGIKLGFMSFFVKAAANALQRYPVVNASVDGDDIIYHGYADISIAVSTERGLVTPVLRNTERLDFAGIEQGIANYAQKAKDGKLSLDDLQGGTFTVTNGGTFGSLLSTPIVNPPQSAILGMHSIKERPVAENGQVVIAPMMYLALSYDHRIIDGKDAVQFLVDIKNQLENPARMLFGL